MKNFTITLSEKDMQLVVNAVAQRPFQEVAQLIAELQKQINAQLGRPEQQGERANGGTDIRPQL